MTSESHDKRTFKIGEVCRVADVQPYVLRYWETEFPPLAPTKSGGGQRLYSQREVDVVLRIKQLLYSEGFTIAGAKKKLEAELRSGGEVARSEAPVVAGPGPAPSVAQVSDDRLKDAVVRVRNELAEILTLLDR